MISPAIAVGLHPASVRRGIDSMGLIRWTPSPPSAGKSVTIQLKATRNTYAHKYQRINYFWIILNCRARVLGQNFGQNRLRSIKARVCWAETKTNCWVVKLLPLWTDPWWYWLKSSVSLRLVASWIYLDSKLSCPMSTAKTFPDKRLGDW